MLQTTRMLLTISVVPDVAIHNDHSYKQDLDKLFLAFQSETQTPLASILRQDDEVGILVLILPGQKGLTELQQHWPYRHSEITGYVVSFSEPQDDLELKPGVTWGRIKLRCRTKRNGPIVTALLNGCNIEVSQGLLRIYPRSVFHHKSLLCPERMEILEWALLCEMGTVPLIQINPPEDNAVREARKILEDLGF